MSGDPVEESGQAVRQGFVQALQTAHTTTGLIRGWGADSRSRTESEQRVALAGAKDLRSAVEHAARLGNLGADYTLTQARTDEVRTRITNADKVTEVDVRHKEAQITRADTDLQRRETDGELARTQSTEVHEKRIASYTNREEREIALHDLDVEYKKLLIEIRRRAAGFTETLYRSDEPTGAGQASAAQFAAADATRDLSPEAEAAAQAYRERLVEDTGLDVEDLFTGSDRAEMADGWSHGLEDVAGLAEDLTIAAHLHHESGLGVDDLDRGPQPDLEVIDAEVVEAGEWIESAVAATAVHDVDPSAPDPGLIDGGGQPSPRAPGTEIEVWRGGPEVGRSR
ncbi:hypothetical protein ACFWM1_26700 [Nocardia sp. NPDC058379]|uniref:hypothetical protein n=1 Tax=unclassified Nocardia TaxID=2637762 RepID=UPI00364D50C5